MRRSDTVRACAFSAAETVCGLRPRPGLLMSRFVCCAAKKLSILLKRARARTRGRGTEYILR
jgi:hypothetical protein